MPTPLAAQPMQHPLAVRHAAIRPHTRRDMVRLLGMAGVGSALAQTSVTASSPADPWPEVSGALANARLAGRTRLRVWGFEVYDAQLWVASGFRAREFAQFPLALSLSYLRALNGPAIAERSLKEMRGIATQTDETAPHPWAQWLKTMTALFPNVQAGDRLTGLHQPALGARFWLNGKPLGEVADPRFSAAFFGIWLHESTSEPALRRELLAGVAP